MRTARPAIQWIAHHVAIPIGAAAIASTIDHGRSRATAARKVSPAAIGPRRIAITRTSIPRRAPYWRRMYRHIVDGSERASSANGSVSGAPQSSQNRPPAQVEWQLPQTLITRAPCVGAGCPSRTVL